MVIFRDTKINDISGDTDSNCGIQRIFAVGNKLLEFGVNLQGGLRACMF